MTQCMQSREHQYIFEPVCASMLLRRNTSKEPLRSRNTPRIEGQVQLEPMSLRLSQVSVALETDRSQMKCQLSIYVSDFWVLVIPTYRDV